MVIIGCMYVVVFICGCVFIWSLGLGLEEVGRGVSNLRVDILGLLFCICIKN